VGQNLCLQRGRDISIALDLITGPDEDILPNSQAPQTASRSEFMIGDGVGARGQDDEEIDIAVITRRAPRPRTKKDDLLWLELCDQPLGHLLQQFVRNRLHGFLDGRALRMPRCLGRKD
jgi:hypothetical protein